MLGWKTHSFNELRLSSSLHRDRRRSCAGSVKHGVACYVSGYHPLFVLASCVSQLSIEPYIAGSAAIGYGFLKGYFTTCLA